jgi:hypothetical protein
MDWLLRFLPAREARANTFLGFDAAGDIEVIPQVPIEGAAADAANLLLSGEGAPEDAARAALTVNPAGDDNSLTFTAVAYGTAGNAITIEYVDPADAEIPLSVDVTGTAIVVTLETDDADAPPMFLPLSRPMLLPTRSLLSPSMRPTQARATMAAVS